MNTVAKRIDGTRSFMPLALASGPCLSQIWDFKIRNMKTAWIVRLTPTSRTPMEITTAVCSSKSLGMSVTLSLRC